MKTPRSYRKFQPHQEKIKTLETHEPRFKRVFNEYQSLSDELWDMESGDHPSAVSDDFLLALQEQTHYLEKEIDDWLGEKP